MNEIIFALASHPGRAALHLHRLSGANVFEKLKPHLFSVNQKQLSFSADTLGPQTKYFLLRDETYTIDDGVVTLFKAPKSYTGEETIEITLHGNPIIAQQAQSLFRRLGFRDAGPGEFTQRAFLNGKIDLAQAEGVAQLIDAENDGALKLAQQVTSGRLSKMTENLRAQLIDVLAYLEAHVDFGADEVGEFNASSVSPKLSDVKRSLQTLADSYAFGEKIKNGVKLALVGQPNAGKSSLYNALLQNERAIVTPIAGTTRDVLSERLIVDKREFVLLDTAGIRFSTDHVESIGIERSYHTMREADCIVVVLDIHTASNINEAQVLVRSQLKTVLNSVKLNESQRVLLVLHKSDLATHLQSTFQALMSEWSQHIWVMTHHQNVSALRQTLVNLHDNFTQRSKAEHQPFLISQRQLDKINLALAAIDDVFSLIVIKQAHPETMASLVNAARLALEELVGEVTLDSIFDKLFSDFCIGK